MEPRVAVVDLGVRAVADRDRVHDARWRDDAAIGPGLRRRLVCIERVGLADGGAVGRDLLGGDVEGADLLLDADHAGVVLGFNSHAVLLERRRARVRARGDYPSDGASYTTAVIRSLGGRHRR